MKYRANELKVILLFNKREQSYTINKYVNIRSEKHTLYEKDQIARATAFDRNLSKVCSDGIHYFLNLECAFYWGFGFNTCNIKWYYLDYDE